MNLFYDIDHVQAITNEWLIKYNNERPHESLGNLTPWVNVRPNALSEHSFMHDTYLLVGIAGISSVIVPEEPAPV